MDTGLTKLVLRYQQLLTSAHHQERKEADLLYQKIEERCLLIIYSYPVSIHVLEEEAAADLLLSLKPRLKHMIDSFSYEGFPFENFIRRIAYMQAHVYIKRLKRRNRKHTLIPYPTDSFDHLIASDYQTSYCALKSKTEGESSCFWSTDTEICRRVKKKIDSSKSFRRRFLQLVLLCSEQLDANQIRFLASYLNMEETELAKSISNAFEKSYMRKERTIHIANIRDYHFLEKCFCEREIGMLKYNNAKPFVIEKMQSRYEREDKLFLERRQQMQNRARSITHEVVAEITKVPKGTVDSGISAIKRYLTNLIDGAS